MANTSNVIIITLPAAGKWIIMRPSLSLSRHHCRTIINPLYYKLQDSYNLLPFKPKSLLYATTPGNISRAARELVLLSKKYPEIQIVTASLDMKYRDVIGEMWFDELIQINGYKPYTSKQKSSRLTQHNEFSIWVHDKKIQLPPFESLLFGKTAFTMYFKQPNENFRPLLTRLELVLPFDKETTNYSSKSQMKPITPKMLITEVKNPSSIKTFNYKVNGYDYVDDVSIKNESEYKDYYYALEVTSKSRQRNRYIIAQLSMFYDNHDKCLIVPEANLNLNEETYAQIFQVCLQDVKEPEITNGLVVECYHRLFSQELNGEDIMIDGVVTLGASRGFNSNGRWYEAPGDYIKVESTE